MSFNIDQSKVKETVAEIISGRAASAERLSSGDGAVRKDADRVRKLKSLLMNLKAGVGESVELDPAIRAVHDTCSEYIELADKLITKSDECHSEIRRIQEHFQRDSFCVASAGGSQAGKSTTLQKIVGMDEDTDSTCPIVGGGTGNSTTATRCRIVNIGTNDKGHARIEFYKRTDFFSKVIQPYCRELQRFGLPLPSMDSYNDFIAFDVKIFESTNQTQLSVLENSERAKKYYVRFCQLRNKADEYDYLLDKSAEDIDIKEAYKYLVYPSAKPQYNALPSLCYAVQEATLYCRYPNPVVENIEFVDLPGAGEVAPDVEKRYAEGFNLKTDTVVYVSRFDGRIYGNADVAMVDILGQVVPPGQLDNYMIHFQNDFHQVSGEANKLVRVADINKGSKKDAYAIIGRMPNARIYRIPAGTGTDQISSDISCYEVSTIGSEGVVVVFGEGNDAEYVSGTLLPVICSFAAERMAFLDQALLKQIQAKIDSVNDEVASLFVSVENAFTSQNRSIPSPKDNFTTSVNKRVEMLRNALWAIRNSIEEDYRSGKLLGDSADCATTVKEIKASMLSEIGDVNSGLFLEATKDDFSQRIKTSVAQNYGVSGQIERYLRFLRVSIAERFSKLESIYTKSIDNIVKGLFTKLRDYSEGIVAAGVPFLEVDSDRGIGGWITLTQNAGCNELAHIAEDLQSLEVSFYITVYPDIRKRVFREAVTDVYKRCFARCTSAEMYYAVFHDLAENWIYESGDCIVEKNAAYEIVFSAVDRFFERTLFSEMADDEMHRLVSFYWDDFDQTKASPLDVCKAKLTAFRTALEKLEGDK